jgi:ribonuclease R
MIHKVLLDGEHPNKYGAYARRAATAASECEIKALNAERRIEALYKTIYMSKFLGEEFVATVSSITSFGMFCTLENTCEGLVPLSEMGYGASFHEKTLTISTKRGSYRLGSTVRVRLEEADIIRGKLRFSIVY